MKTAAIYTRVSSEVQRENKTIGSQVDGLIQFAGEVGYVVPEPYIFKDEGYSGAILIRPGLEKVRDLSAEGRIQAVLIHSPDRLSRNYAYQVVLLDEFSANGTEVLFVNSPKADTPEQALLLQFQGMISEYERAMITERSRRGKRFKAKTGVVNVLGGAPYGYTYIKKTDESLARYEINEEEALIVKEIFRMYTEDFCGIGAVARTLSSRKILTRTKLTRWERSVVWSMLRNPAYCGKACFGKTGRAERQRITKPLRTNGGYVVQNGCNREKPREEWIEIPVPAIISQETFDMAQERLKTNKQHSKRNTNIETLLQSGIMVCRECGYSLYRTYTTTSAGNKIFYYRCFGSDPYRFEGVRKCNCKPLRQDYIDNIVWEELVRLIQDPRLILSEIERRVDAAKKTNPLVNQKSIVGKTKGQGDEIHRQIAGCLSGRPDSHRTAEEKNA